MSADPMAQLRNWAHEFGFSQIGVADIDLSHAEEGLRAWLEAGFHGSMAYMARHGMVRARPAELVPGTVSVVCVAMDYLPEGTTTDWQAAELNRLTQPEQATVSLYARGRDYHKVLRQRLEKMTRRMREHWGAMGYRVFTDSAPVLEVELASRAGLGWRGKHTLLLDRHQGSMFFWVRSSSTGPCLARRRSRTIAAVAAPASTHVPRVPSSRPIGSMPGVAFRT